MIRDSGLDALVRSLLSLPERSTGVYVDHRPGKYIVRDLTEFCNNHNIPIKCSLQQRKIKIGDRYILYCTVREIHRTCVGRTFNTGGRSKYTNITPKERSIIRDRVRGGFNIDYAQVEEWLI